MYRIQMCFIGESGQQIEFKFEKKRLFYLPHNRSKTSVGVVNVRYEIKNTWRNSGS